MQPASKFAFKIVRHVSDNDPGHFAQNSDWLRAGRPEFTLRNGTDFSLLYHVRTGPGTNPLSYLMDIERVCTFQPHSPGERAYSGTQHT
jgi:hypothetical protein